MENVEKYESPSFFDMGFDDYGQLVLQKGAKWAKFIALFWIIATGLGLLLLIVASTFMERYFGNALPGWSSSSSVGVIMIISYLVVGAFVLLPAIFLLRFANQTQKAIIHADVLLLENAFSSLRTVFVVLGIYAIIFALIGVYGLFTAAPRVKYYDY
jgi:hypothetical protein